MKPWYLSNALIQKIHHSEKRRLWCETGAHDYYYELEQRLPTRVRDRARVGAIYVSEMLGTEGENFWFFPIEGHKKILKPKSEICFFTKEGDIYFEGHWESCSEEVLLRNEEFYLWLKPIQGREQASFSFRQRLVGLSRWVRHKLKS